MNINEVAGLLGYSKEKVEALMKDGLELPKSKKVVKLQYTDQAGNPDISDQQFNDFVNQFEAEEPGRWPPAEVRRELLVEARHLCAICRQPAPPQYHHMLDFAKVKHHDPKRMLSICGTCHHRCTIGQIDYKAQMHYKAQMQQPAAGPNAGDPVSAKKREKDLATIRHLFSYFPRQIAAWVLEEGSWDRIHTEHTDALLAAEGIVRSPLFHLNDSELEDLIVDFFGHWSAAWAVGPETHHDFLHRGLATLSIPETASTETWDRHKVYLEHVEQARVTLGKMNKYLAKNYADFDVDASDAEAARQYWEMTERVKRESEERWAKLKAELDAKREDVGRELDFDEVMDIAVPAKVLPKEAVKRDVKKPLAEGEPVQTDGKEAAKSTAEAGKPKVAEQHEVNGPVVPAAK